MHVSPPTANPEIHKYRHCNVPVYSHLLWSMSWSLELALVPMVPVTFASPINMVPILYSCHQSLAMPAGSPVCAKEMPTESWNQVILGLVLNRTWYTGWQVSLCLTLCTCLLLLPLSVLSFLAVTIVRMLPWLIWVNQASSWYMKISTHNTDLFFHPW